MTSGKLGLAWRVLCVGGLGSMTVLASLTSCGDDVAQSGTGNTSDGGMGGSGGTTSMGGTGGTPNPVTCDYDLKCTTEESCSCEDCWYEPLCNEGGVCGSDGACGDGEGCHCPDCAGLDECADYCISCHSYLTYYTSGDATCEGASKAAYDGLESCVCTSICVSECGTSFCNGLGPSSDCQTCMDDNCPNEIAACNADTKPAVKCNPITGAPCNTVQEVCDRIEEGDIVTGFQCRLRTNNADLCDACNYNFGSNSYCKLGMTCGDGTGDIAIQGNCAKYCCDDGDCGTGTCLKTGAFAATGLDIGVCETVAAGAGCDAPEMVPSMGSCVTLTP